MNFVISTGAKRSGEICGCPRTGNLGYLYFSLLRSKVVEAPCFSRGELDFSPAGKSSILNGFSPGIYYASAKAHDRKLSFSKERWSAPSPA